MFNKKYKQRISELERENEDLYKMIEMYEEKAMDIPKYSFADLMRESLGFPLGFSEASKDRCMPPHYLDGLAEDERKSFVSDMETIYSNDKFQKVVHYMINVFGMNALFKEDEQDRKNGQIAIIAFRTFLQRFEDMHKEFLESKRNPDVEFDKHGILPE